MADVNYATFSKRKHAIEKRHREMSGGYIELVERDGLLVPKSSRRQRRLPLRGMAIILMLFLVFKGFLIVQLGSTTFSDRVDKLANGSPVEQVGAWVMAIDPISMWISEQMKTLM
ncbi:hypothetical protein O2N63_04630 [Aliiroseovarius sp. KMU-50]|uniref:Uncharacterized protein n=1 Tax=Aliiroseovarius salicola TaxID=3009082 RepID=A0ABT4VYM8_9RHOB|nr:hypothetical protein [Aliiroseovarius sp. KMU-50]MDA5093368.1 hypothetical protein [Aliiroseovarius sp. KMU-50]